MIMILTTTTHHQPPPPWPYLCIYCTPGQTKVRPPGTRRGFLWQHPDTTIASLGPQVWNPQVILSCLLLAGGALATGPPLRREEAVMELKLELALELEV